MITAPTQISGLQVWLDASDTTTLFQLSGGTTAVGDGNPVGYWGDKSGNNRHFLNNAGTTASRPTYVSSLSTIRFDGVNDYLSSFFNVTYTAQTVFVVVSKRVQVTAARIYTQVSTGTDNAATGHFIPCVDNAAGQLASYSAGNYRSLVSTRSLSTFDVFTSWFSSTSAVNFINGSSGTYAGLTLNYSVTLSRLGAQATNPSAYFNGDISEVVVYNRALTNAEREDVEYYLSRKWSVVNSIPRQVYALKNGNWSDTNIWSVSADPSPWNVPLSADNVYTNTFTVTADSSTKVDAIRNSTLAPNILSGGSFWLANGVSLSANVVGGVAPYTLTLLPAASSTLVGNITGSSLASTITLSAHGTTNLTIVGNMIKQSGANNTALVNSSTGTLTIYGNISGFNFSETFLNQSSGTINIFGNVFGANSTNGRAISNSGSEATFNIIGNLYGGNSSNASHTFNNTATCIVNLTGNLYGSTGSGFPGAFISTAGTLKQLGDVIADGGNAASFSSTGSILLTGNVIASNGSGALISTSTTTPLSVYGNIINAPNGRQAIYAPRYQVFPTGSAQYTRQAVNGYDSYVDYWTSNSTFSYPASSDVVTNTTYSNGTLSGSMALPSPSSVALGVPVGVTTGTASITINNVFEQPISNLNAPNSIGARLKNVTTSQALSAIVDSLKF